MRKIILVLAVFFLFASSCLADGAVVYGGLREGLALGLGMENKITERMTIRYGFGASVSANPSTMGTNPFMAYAGIKYPLFISFGYCPTSLGLGVAADFGTQTQAGGSCSIIFDNIYNQEKYYLEIGADIFSAQVNPVLLVGYRF